MRLLVLLGLAIIGLVVLRTARAAESRRRAASILTARLEALEPAFAAEHAATPIFDPRRPLPIFLERMLVRADIEPRLDIVAIGGFALLVAGLAFGYFLNPLIGIAIVLGGFIGAFFLLRAVGDRRAAQFVDALPHFLDANRQLLMAGYAFQQAFLKAAENASPAIKRYLAPAQRRIYNGSTTAEALTWTAERIDNPELHMLATAVRTNVRFGGAIGPILGELSKILRTRARVGRELRAATSEIRASGMVLTALPPAVILIVAILNISYIRMLWETATGHHILAIALVLEIIGTLIMRRLMRLEF
jgi:tight adherence protein B